MNRVCREAYPIFLFVGCFFLFCVSLWLTVPFGRVAGVSLFFCTHFSSLFLCPSATFFLFLGLLFLLFRIPSFTVIFLNIIAVLLSDFRLLDFSSD